MLQIFFFFSEEAKNENPAGKYVLFSEEAENENPPGKSWDQGTIGLRKLSGNCGRYSILMIIIEN